MTNKLKINRELAERFAHGRFDWSHIAELRALLAAPAVERQDHDLEITSPMALVNRYFAIGPMIKVEYGIGDGIFVAATDFDSLAKMNQNSKARNRP